MKKQRIFVIINSPFKDYYDSVARSGVDKTTVWNRTPQDFHGSLSEEEKRNGFRLIPKEALAAANSIARYCSGGYTKDISYFPVLVCGDIYVLLTEFDYINGHKQRSMTEAEFVEWRKDRKKGNYYSLFRDPFKDSERVPDEDRAIIHRVMDSPIVMIEDRKITINPKLKDIGLFLNAGDLFQKIHSFLSPKEPVMVKTADKYRIEAHGFNKESFRREKGGPTRKRKKLLAKKA